MSKQTKQTKNKAVFEPFLGIDAQNQHQGTPGTASMVNFRIKKDGSLTKREGHHHITRLPNNIYAVWTGKLFGEVQTILLSGSYVIRFYPDTGTTSVLGNLQSPPIDNPQFFFYRDRLYLPGKDRIYEIKKNSVAEIEAYVPLIGKDWPTTHIGEIHEPRNLLTRRARIHYLIPQTPSIFLRTGYPVESIQAVYINDVLKASSDYSYDAPTQSILIASLKEGDRVRVHLTYTASSEGSEASDLLSCSRAEVFGDTENNRIFFWNGTKKNTFYTSRYVSNEALAESALSVSTSVPLYFPEHSARVLGDGRYNVTGFIRQYDRLLIFNEQEAYMTNIDLLSSDHFSVKPINPSVGCSDIGACAVADNTPFTVSHKQICRWTTETDEYNQSNALDISDPIRPLLSEKLLKTANLFFYQSGRELLLYSYKQDDPIWIYHLDSGAWYCFSNIPAELFFEINDKLYFCHRNCISAFDPLYYEDMDDGQNESEIVAKFDSHILEYGSSEKKIFSALTVRADCDGGSIRILLLGNGISPLEQTVLANEAHSTLRYRLRSGRFQHATISIIAEGIARQTIHSLISEVR